MSLCRMRTGEGGAANWLLLWCSACGARTGGGDDLPGLSAQAGQAQGRAERSMSAYRGGPQLRNQFVISMFVARELTVRPSVEP